MLNAFLYVGQFKHFRNKVCYQFGKTNYFEVIYQIYLVESELRCGNTRIFNLKIQHLSIVINFSKKGSPCVQIMLTLSSEHY